MRVQRPSKCLRTSKSKGQLYVGGKKETGKKEKKGKKREKEEEKGHTLTHRKNVTNRTDRNKEKSRERFSLVPPKYSKKRLFFQCGWLSYFCLIEIRILVTYLLIFVQKLVIISSEFVI